MDSTKSTISEDSRLSDIVHEFRTPLASIMGFAEIILSEPGLDAAKRQEFTSIIKQEGARLSNLIDTLVEQSLFELQRSMLPHGEHDMVSILMRSLDTIQKQVDAKSLSLRTEFRHPSISVRCDRGRISKVLALLLSCAADAARDHGTVTVGACVTGSMVQFWVGDDGPGIPAREIPLIFQGGSSDDRDEFLPGFDVARAIIELHGGTLSVQSKEHEGTRFIATLPIGAP